ncbi:hypothetical protein PR048_030972 [Dryococelus australis]|uniref:ERCC1-like central domain-containing protein n=1 Tax=Dryococelus australis TaxID=614101 RepID=A0ABQ9GCZ9_9NEOP|nr:hypothetical protein PR048_030972 [Dryococelus australis]
MLVAAFSNLKKSEFYKAPEPVASTSSDGNPVKLSDMGVVRTTGSKTNGILVSPKQRGNPLLKAICNVPWEYSEIVPDYVMGKTTCALFLSLRYHNLNPDYINERLKQLGKQYELRVLLVQVDTKEPQHALKNITRICILADLTLMLAWSSEEAGRIIETYKIYESKPPDMIMERHDSSPYQQLVMALTSVRSVNKTDAATLLSTFGSLDRVVRATPDALNLCPGLGFQKASRLHKVFHQPFLRARAAAGSRPRTARK